MSEDVKKKKLRLCPFCGSDNVRLITDRSRSVARFRCFDCNKIWGPWPPDKKKKEE